MIKILGVDITVRSALLALVHTAIETVVMVVWLALALDAAGVETKMSSAGIAAVTVLFVGLFIEHVVALAPGKVA
jgi:predicted CoA-binding protein